jgi:hypothetical protein
VRDGIEAERQLHGPAVNGVHGRSCMVRSNYVLSGITHITIDSMHCFYNIVRDCINAIRAHHGAQWTNRTYKATIKKACVDARIFLNEFDPLHAEPNEKVPPPPWVFTSKEIKKCDKRMLHIIGQVNRD